LTAMQDLNDLYFFAQVVDHQGFAAAAREAAQEAIERARAEPQGVVRVSCAASMLYFRVGEMVSPVSWPTVRRSRCTSKAPIGASM
jgi:hypothetical protein